MLDSSGLFDHRQNIACVKRKWATLCSTGRTAAPDNRGTRETGTPLSGRSIAEVAVRVRAICVAALATGLLGGVAGCAPGIGPSDPVLDGGAPAGVSPASYTEPNDWIPSETPDELEPIYVAPRHRAPLQAAPTRVQRNRYSGGSSAPASGRAATRPGRARQTGTRSHDWPDLDEWQAQAQWISPPPGAGE
jgi:hypothetical protein